MFKMRLTICNGQNTMALCLLVVLVVLASVSLANAAPLHDPTLPLDQRGKTAVVVDSWKLHSILFSKQRKLAIINGKAVRENQSVNGALVREIHADHVRLEKDGRRWQLYLHSAAARSAASIRK